MSSVLKCSGYEVYDTNIVKGLGCYLYNDTGERYVDFESGVWCTALGHNHPDVNSAIVDQLGKIIHLGYRYNNPVVEESARQILDIVKIPSGKTVFLSSGSEAVEFGVKTTRLITGKPLLLGLSGSYLAAYGSAGKKDANEWFSFNWSDCATCSRGCGYECPKLKEIPLAEIGGFVFEPGNSSGQVKLPPRKLIRTLAALVRENDGIIMVNEVTTGFGRTGEWFGHFHYDISPDIVAMGKGMGNGYPVSAVAFTEEINFRVEESKLRYAQSHQNDALGCAVVTEVIRLIRTQNLIERSRQVGERFKMRLEALAKKHRCINEVRGIGLMLAMELSKDNGSLLTELHRKLFGAGYLVGYNPAANLLRFYPPLIISEEDIDGLLLSLDSILGER